VLAQFLSVDLVADLVDLESVLGRDDGYAGFWTAIIASAFRVLAAVRVRGILQPFQWLFIVEDARLGLLNLHVRYASLRLGHDPC
jgi:hypothetical protein